VVEAEEELRGVVVARATHRKAAIIGWFAFVVLAVLVGGRIGQNDLDQSARGSGESKRGDMIVRSAGFPEQAGEQVLVQGKGSVRAGDPAMTAAVSDVVRRLQRIDGVTNIESPLDPGARANTVSADGRSVVVNFAMRGSEQQVETLVEQPLAAVAAARADHPGVRVEEFGKVSAAKAIKAQDAKDGKRSQLISTALMLVILLVAFGSVVAAGLPLVLGATAVAGTVGLLGPVSQLYALPADVAELVVIIGVAVGVDYAMFYSRRVLEERDRGRSVEAAVEFAAATSGRAVLVALGSDQLAKQIGVGLAAAILIDATIVRAVLLPATMKLLGERNWYLPRRLGWLPRLRPEATAVTA
jgi:uncharacterized membrane protein YdfJ with MMPL/SSD domain